MTQTPQEDAVYPVEYVKDGASRFADDARAEVKLKYEGYRKVVETGAIDPPVVEEPEPTYAELQAQAKEYPDVKGNLPYDELLEAVAEAAQFQHELDFEKAVDPTAFESNETTEDDQ